jgi:pimeloyl-ACP methyl ester carboxylesterase
MNMTTSALGKIIPPNDPSFHSGYAEVNGLRMYYEQHGSGSPLLLIHGGGSTIGSSFGRIIPALALHHLVIAVELQNHGRTGSREVPQTFEQDADDVAALLDELGVEKVNVMGFSNGGHTTIELPLRHPEKLQRIILVSVPTKREGFPPGFFDNMTGAVLSQMPQGLQDAFLEVNPDQARLQHMFEQDRDRMIAFRGWTDEQIRSVNIPALLINGDADVIMPEHAVEVHRMLANSRLAIIPGIHGACLGEITTLGERYQFRGHAVSLILDFLKEDDAA